ncbi:aldo/keto reductase [Laccaria bicolor S238N-H82]|uniref:Aado/keto reductase n=1 Tax=Laccaria bicolor (strain S238N-H82 / ATCC MYA-4686) TaxID=486041 RepID=B0D0Y5_LACBS|nr:aldo/keto reductase [Laccaria bicolor S238N-H82]EDR11535.1 aado/keto reductase [Laccaria bicolor S238N-H82]|eukprot:XP_001877432.1 aado/keto reductase [Laccaria bicolor S238N-H82]
MSSLTPDFTLNNGTTIPAIGMGCWMGSVTAGDGNRVVEMCAKALRNGYRHFDTAAGYGNEKMVGDAIKASGIPRKSLYITTKLANPDHHRVREAFEDSLRDLDCEYIDLYLLHWPQAQAPTGNAHVLGPDEHPTFIETWKEMEKLLETGKVKTLGVSNFSCKTLEALLPHCQIVPAVNQVEMHPYLPQNDVKALCEEKGILLTAYSPLGRSATLFEDPTIQKIAEKGKVTPAQVVLAWGVQRGTAVVPKSEDDGRMTANLNLIKLTDEDMEEINAIHLQEGKHRSLLKYHTPEGTVMGWTYEQLGWNMLTGGIVCS